MKKLVSLAVVIAAVAILGTTLTGAASDEATSSASTSAKSTKPCCQDKAADVKAVVAETPEAECCSKGKKTSTVLTKTEACSGDSCNTAKQATGKCPLCASEVAAVSDNNCQGQAGKAGHCGGKCDLDAAAKLVTTTASGEKCCSKEDCKTDGGKCAEAKAVSTASDTAHQCGSCKGACTEECSSCAEARKEASADKTELVATKGKGGGMGHGHAGDSQHAKDHQDFFFLIEHRDKIRRTIKNIPNGVETLTESDADDVASMIQTHVEAMYDRMEHAKPIRMRDPIFREVFANGKKIKMEIEHTDKGIRVKETSDDKYVVKLVQEHAKVVSLWIKNGYSELPKNHAAPTR